MRTDTACVLDRLWRIGVLEGKALGQLDTKLILVRIGILDIDVILSGARRIQWVRSPLENIGLKKQLRLQKNNSDDLLLFPCKNLCSQNYRQVDAME